MKQLRGRETFWLVGSYAPPAEEEVGGKEKNNYIHIRIYILYRLAVCRGWVEVDFFRLGDACGRSIGTIA